MTLRICQLPPEQKRLVKAHLDATEDKQAQPRIPGLHTGMIWTSDDFDDVLPDEFWLGEDE
ncbi:MAG: DUF2281 domain-containing protein [Anaerolineaceae bacterium]|nr:DUF2281 domain-containing protein [Anaerolineaceae bacterium]